MRNTKAFMKLYGDGDVQQVIEKMGVEVIKLSKRAKRSKVIAIMAVFLGLAYAIKNENDKDELRFQLLELDKSHQFATGAERNESEDDTDSAFI